MLYAIAAVLVLIADQAVKYWTTKNIVLNAVGADCKPIIDGVVHMTNVHNYGAAFGILQNARWPLALVSALFVIVIIMLISREVIHTRFGRWTVVLVMAGALGNCIDRVLYGYVVDMFEVEFMNFAVFNVADMFITVCGILFCIHLIFHNEPVEVREANAPEFIRLRRQRKAEEARLAAEARQAEEESFAPDPVPVSVQSADDLGEWTFGDEPAPAPAPRSAAEPAPAPAPKKRAPKPGPAPAPAPKKRAPKPEPAPAPAEEKDFPDYEIEEFTLEDILAEFGDD